MRLIRPSEDRVAEILGTVWVLSEQTPVFEMTLVIERDQINA
ncbi:MAG: hypothetical protein ACXWNK_05260 [Vulcanimicrobiaceae bacterium]